MVHTGCDHEFSDAFKLRTGAYGREGNPRAALIKVRRSICERFPPAKTAVHAPRSP
jgi:hypothetical protein